MNLTPITFFVQGRPETKGSARAIPFLDRRGRPQANVINDNPKAKSWQTLVSVMAAAAMRGRQKLEGPVRVDITFYLTRPQSHYRTNGQLKPFAPTYVTTKPDRDKLERCAMDALTGVVFGDDSQSVKGGSEKVYANPGQPIGARFTITQLVEAATELLFEDAS